MISSFLNYKGFILINNFYYLKYLKMLKKYNPSADDFESLYLKENPWRTDGSLRDLIRIKIINNYFKKVEFNKGIDIACGEGYCTSRLSFIKNKSGIDISSLAIKRAIKNYSEINFTVGNPFKDVLSNDKYDFVSCFEALYYPTSTTDREKAIINLLELGHKDAIFAYSVVTIGSNKHRDYYTKESFKKLVSKYYKIVDIIPVTLKSDKLIFRIIQKLISYLSKRLATKLFYKRTLNSIDKNVYQHLFILKKI